MISKIRFVTLGSPKKKKKKKSLSNITFRSITDTQQSKEISVRNIDNSIILAKLNCTVNLHRAGHEKKKKKKMMASCKLLEDEIYRPQDRWPILGSESVLTLFAKTSINLLIWE